MVHGVNFINQHLSFATVRGARYDVLDYGLMLPFTIESGR